MCKMLYLVMHERNQIHQTCQNDARCLDESQSTPVDAQEEHPVMDSKTIENLELLKSISILPFDLEAAGIAGRIALI